MFRNILKIIVVALFVCSCAISTIAQNNQIAYIKDTYYWYELYNINNEKINAISKSNGTLCGYSSDYFIMKKYNWYDLYNTNCQKYNSISTSNGTYVGITNDYFQLESLDKHWIYIYNKKGDKIRTISR